jgi:hypothetical protein
MARRSGGCLSSLVVLVLLGWAAWHFRDRIMGFIHKDEAPLEVSQAAADEAMSKLDRMRQSGDTVSLSDVEFTSLLRYKLASHISGDVYAPSVKFNGDTVRLRGKFPTDRLPDAPEIRRVREFLPDTADVDVRGKMRSYGEGKAALAVDAVAFARMPIPRNMYASALKQMGRGDEPGLMPNEYPVHLPPGVASARVEGGRLILTPSRQ